MLVSRSIPLLGVLVCQAQEKVETAEAKIVNSQGLHARSVMRFVELASEFSAEVLVDKGEGTERVPGKDPMQMMLLAAPVGTVLRIMAKGDDAPEALKALVELVADGFGE